MSTTTKTEEMARAELFSSADPALRREAETGRARLLASTDRMQKGTEKLRAARQTALETEQIGANIMADLETQRQTLERSRATLAGANVGLDRSRKILSGMGRRAQANKALMCLIILALIGMIFLIIWLKWFFTPSNGSSSERELHLLPPSPSPRPPPSPREWG